MHLNSWRACDSQLSHCQMLAGQFVTPFHVADDYPATVTPLPSPVCHPVLTHLTCAQVQRILSVQNLSFPPFFSVHSMHLIGRLLNKASTAFCLSCWLPSSRVSAYLSPCRSP